MIVSAPMNESELRNLMFTAQLESTTHPFVIRYPRGEGSGAPLPKRGQVLPLGKGRILREGSAVALLSFGARLAEALRAGDQLAGFGLSATVADARFAKPLDEDLVRQLACHHEVLITIEEGSSGGFGSQVLQLLAREGLLDPLAPVAREQGDADFVGSYRCDVNLKPGGPVHFDTVGPRFDLVVPAKSVA